MRLRTHQPRASARLILSLAIVASMMVVASTPASGHHCSGSGQVDDRGGDVVAECHGQTPGQPGGRTVHETWGIYCSAALGVFVEGDEVTFDQIDQLTPQDVEHLGFDPTGEYWWWSVTCWRDGEVAHSHEIAVEVTPPVPPETMRDIAAARLVPPVPVPETSPPLAREAFVRVPTWLWLDAGYWVPLESSETRGLTTVTVRATPTHARWVMGDGGGVTCEGPGVSWVSGLAEDGTDCSYTYLHSSYDEPDGSFGASVTVTWEFEWWINDAYRGVFGSVDPSTSFAVSVAEIQAIETGG
jgi:hypothetical protein